MILSNFNNYKCGFVFSMRGYCTSKDVVSFDDLFDDSVVSVDVGTDDKKRPLRCLNLILWRRDDTYDSSVHLPMLIKGYRDLLSGLNNDFKYDIYFRLTYNVKPVKYLTIADKEYLKVVIDDLNHLLHVRILPLKIFKSEYSQLTSSIKLVHTKCVSMLSHYNFTDKLPLDFLSITNKCLKVMNILNTTEKPLLTIQNKVRENYLANFPLTEHDILINGDYSVFVKNVTNAKEQSLHSKKNKKATSPDNLVINHNSDIP